jgi:prephenate dehydratase
MSDSLRKIAYLGPSGSFAEVALRASAVYTAGGVDAVPAKSVLHALESVRNGEVAAALVPIENSVEGSVTITLDELASGKRLVITNEVVLRVEFTLLVRPGTKLSDIHTISTHPHAQAQVRNWLNANLPDADVIPAMSTSAAAAALMGDNPPFDAAIGQALNAEIYGLEILADQIGDSSDAYTRFVIVELPGDLPAPTGADKTTLSVFQRSNHPGGLLEILTEFAVRGINLTRLESRPTKKTLGDYYFSLDFEGHVNDLRVEEALMGLHRVCLDIRFLGSYPRHDGLEPVLRAGVTDTDFETAQAWLDKLKGTE